MSIIHVNQIKVHITRLFDGKIDMSDVSGSKDNIENFFLTRALAAYTISYIAHTSVETSASAITDGGNDNGIDAIFYDDREKRLYVVQSKWIHDGLGEPENGEVKKFVAGIKDLFNLKLERFNQKVNQKKDTIIKALNDPYTTYSVILTYTGINNLALPSDRDLKDLEIEMNDASDVLSILVLNQTPLHSSLTIGITGEPIDLDIGIKSWGRIQEPQTAYYGQLNALIICEWWAKYRDRLFAKNLRGVLGDTDVNNEIRETLINKPQQFWYFNNGITIVSKRVTKTMVGGGDTDFGTFHCEDANVVNGAQTVSTIGKHGEIVPNRLEKVFVPIRIISLENSENDFGESVTRTNNRQNRIENRDFVTLDPEQSRIKTELAIDSVNYHVIRSDSFVKNEFSFDLVEGTTALACASGKVNLAVQLKREIGKLWDDISKAPYKELFNPSVSGLYVWRCVQAQRKIDEALDQIIDMPTLSGRDYGIAVHGNRIIALLVFNNLPTSRFSNPNFVMDSLITGEIILQNANKFFEELRKNVDQNYNNAIIPTLFKNLSKCKNLVDLCQSDNNDT